MKARISRPLAVLSFGAALALGTMIASAEPAAQPAPSTPGEAPAAADHADHGGHAGHGGMMGGDMEQMRSMMHEMMSKMASHAHERIAALKTELKITDAQLPQWNGFAEALDSAAHSMHEMHHAMMQPAEAEHKHSSEAAGATNYPDWKAIRKSAAGAASEHGASSSGGLPTRLEHYEKMLSQHLATLEAIKAALEPLYATFSDEQKKIADGLMVGPMGVM
ncbi:Spy/CpxP family protein refolding chaperone [Methylocapsa polymorpha]|uniref:Spy/CpxP family protein refolding chaperone n=1 Tax=Methylocapsa polymorpha TaxID=3080828 RepID=A0ABZ0HY89_9HYPH|nr:Spy/CpxP family protein refolding chaperone [Methylocapsa sp. RX1]